MLGSALASVAAAAWLLPRPAAPGSPSPVLLFAVVGILSALAAAGGALLRRDQQAGADPAPRTTPAAAPAKAAEAAELSGLRRSAERKSVLARNVAELLPRMPEGLAWQVEKALAQAGVRQVVPDGEPFDAGLHHAVGTEPVPAGGREDTVARTIRPGYADETGILVYPKVVVYAAGGRDAEFPDESQR
jgi:hypothetical protein